MKRFLLWLFGLTPRPINLSEWLRRMRELRIGVK
jgi:hypothetical protein